MIEPTDEMLAAFQAAWDHENRVINESPGEYVEAGARDRAGLAAVLAIVARDRCLAPAGHSLAAPVTDPCLCGADLGPPWDSTPHQKGGRGCRGDAP